MPTPTTTFLSKRDAEDDSDDAFGNYFYSEQGRAVRYGILLGIIFIFFAFILVSYHHATIRMKRGLAPLPYHRWLMSRKQRAQFEASRETTVPEETFSFYQSDHALHPVPPPAYNPNYTQPPSYPGPPESVTKIAPDQNPPPSYTGIRLSDPTPTAGPSSTEQRS